MRNLDRLARLLKQSIETLADLGQLGIDPCSITEATDTPILGCQAASLSYTPTVRLPSSAARFSVDALGPLSRLHGRASALVAVPHCSTMALWTKRGDGALDEARALLRSFEITVAGLPSVSRSLNARPIAICRSSVARFPRRFEQSVQGLKRGVDATALILMPIETVTRAILKSGQSCSREIAFHRPSSCTPAGSVLGSNSSNIHRGFQTAKGVSRSCPLD